jgi:hypothetical protein
MHATPAIFDDKISADVFGSRRALASASLATYITPEQIKDDLERFCSDPDILNAFYAETQAALIAAAAANASDHETSNNGDNGSPAAPDRKGSGSKPHSRPQTPLQVARDKELAAVLSSPSLSSSPRVQAQRAAAAQPQQQGGALNNHNNNNNKKRNSSIVGVRTGSSLLRPVAETDLEELTRGNGGAGIGGGGAAGGLGGLGGIPEMRLPESLQGNGNASRFWGVGRRRVADPGGGTEGKEGTEGRERSA